MESPQPLMRAVARFALLQGWTQEELANRLGQSGSNLTRRFTGSGTRLTTMRRFARELGFPDQYVNLMLGEDIDSAELKAAKHLLDLELRYAEHEFAPTVQHDVQLLLSRMRSDRLESVLRSFLIAWHEEQIGIPSVPRPPSPPWPRTATGELASFARTIKLDLNLFALCRPLSSTNQALFRDVYVLLLQARAFDHDDALEIISFMRSILRLKGFEYAALDEFLAEDSMFVKSIKQRVACVSNEHLHHELLQSEEKLSAQPRREPAAFNERLQ